MSSSSNPETTPPSVDALTEIRILTAFLGHEHAKWNPSNIHELGYFEGALQAESESGSAKAYSHFANLLNINKEIVVAVTGTIVRGKPTTIIYSTNSKSSHPWDGENIKTTSKTFTCPTETSTQAINIDGMLKLKASALSLEEYVSNLFSLLVAYEKTKYNNKILRILKWVVFYSWSKLHKWLKRHQRFQRGDLFELLEAWRLSNDDMGLNNSDGEIIPKITTETPIYISKSLLSACQRHKLNLQNIEDPDAHPMFVLNINSAEQLIHGIASAFKEIQTLDRWIFPEEQKQPSSQKKVSKNEKAQTPLQRLVSTDAKSKSQPGNQPPTQLDFVVEDILLLSTILEDKDVQAVFRNTSLLSQLMPSQPGAGPSGLTPLTTPGPIKLANDNDDDDIGPLSKSDYNGAFALRYMRMIVSPATALIYLCTTGVLKDLRTIEATLINLVERPRSRDPQHAHDTVYHSLLPGLTEYLQSKAGYTEKIGDEARKWLTTHWNASNVPSESACHIHAEAGLMALACDMRQSPSKYATEPYIASFQADVSAVPIGINMKCCSLCFKLGQLLNAKNSEVDIKFQLPNTHEVIFAWDPPAFGIPDSIWEALRKELREQLFQMVATAGQQYLSLTSQSSPTSGSQPSDSPTSNGPRDVLFEQQTEERTD